MWEMVGAVDEETGHSGGCPGLLLLPAVELQGRFCFTWKLHLALTLVTLRLFQIPPDAKHKLVYVAKKMTESTGVADFWQTVLFGEIPASSLGHVTAFLDEVLVCL